MARNQSPSLRDIDLKNVSFPISLLENDTANAETGEKSTIQHTKDVVWSSNHRVSVLRTEDKIGERAVGTAPVSSQTVHNGGNDGKTESETATAFSQKISSELGSQGTPGCLGETVRICEKKGTSVKGDSKGPSSSNNSHCNCHYPVLQQDNQIATVLLEQSDTQNTSETTTPQITDSNHHASRTGQKETTVQDTNTTTRPESHGTRKISRTPVKMMLSGHSSPDFINGSLSTDKKFVNGGQCEHDTGAPSDGLDRTTDSRNGQVNYAAG